MKREGRLLNCIELVIVVGVLAVPVGVNFSILDQEKPPQVPPTYLEPPP
jgi:hypothetical protein